MAYVKTVWQNGSAPALNADNLNKIENELESQDTDISELRSAIAQGGGFNAEVKAALDQFTASVLQLAEKVAYIDANGQDYYDDIDDAADALHSAMYPPVNLSSITAVYTQSGTVYTSDTLDSLKSDLVVTAHYSDSTTAVVTAYVLSGTLIAGTSTITVTYGGKTTTFTVTVTEAPLYPLANGSVQLNQRNLTVTNGNHVLYTNASASGSGTGFYGNLSDYSLNTGGGTAGTVYRGAKLFTIPANAECAFSVTPISLVSLNSNGYSVQPYATAEGNDISGSGISFVPGETEKKTVTFTPSTDVDIHCIGMYARNSNSSVEIEIELLVNGTRYI